MVHCCVSYHKCSNKIKVIEMKTKACKICKEVKNINMFFGNRNTKDKHVSYCMECQTAYSRVKRVMKMKPSEFKQYNVKNFIRNTSDLAHVKKCMDSVRTVVHSMCIKFNNANSRLEHPRTCIRKNKVT